MNSLLLYTPIISGLENNTELDCNHGIYMQPNIATHVGRNFENISKESEFL